MIPETSSSQLRIMKSAQTLLIIFVKTERSVEPCACFLKQTNFHSANKQHPSFNTISINLVTQKSDDLALSRNSIYFHIALSLGFVRDSIWPSNQLGSRVSA